MSFWEQPKTAPQQKPWEQPQAVVLDEEAVAMLQEDPNVDIFEEEDDDTAIVMSDANLRLEQGRLYQMVLQGDIFADTNADPRAIRNVQREIRKYVRERMETMLGIRQEQAVQQTIVSSPFNDLEVTALKMVASKVTKGATESQPQSAPQAPPAAPKKDGISSISGELRPQAIKTVAPTKPALPKTAPKPLAKPAKSAISAQESALQKPIDEMTPEELTEYNRQAEERSRQKYAKMPNNLVPHPSPQQLEMLYTGVSQNLSIANPWRSNG